MPSRVTILFSVLALLASTAAAYRSSYDRYSYSSYAGNGTPATKAGTTLLFVFLLSIVLPIVLFCIFYVVIKMCCCSIKLVPAGQTQTEEEKEKEEQLIKKSKLLL